jgi:hypothetical protein
MNASVNPLGRSKPVSANKEVKQCVEAYLASEQAKQLRSPAREKKEELLETFVRLSYEDKARAPQYLTGDELDDLLEESLPPYLDPKDSALGHLPALLASFFEFLQADRKLSHPVEVRESLARAKDHLREWVTAVPKDKRISSEKPQTIVNADAKAGRNDPCPCGSGKKYKKCHGA